jgi:hypothetical protein
MIRELFYAQKYAATAYNSSAIRTVPSATEFHRFGLQAGSWAVTTGQGISPCPEESFDLPLL